VMAGIEDSRLRIHSSGVWSCTVAGTTSKRKPVAVHVQQAEVYSNSAAQCHCMLLCCVLSPSLCPLSAMLRYGVP
jgi:hypothetical protein